MKMGDPTAINTQIGGKNAHKHPHKFPNLKTEARCTFTFQDPEA
jgi:hypothetical protein